MQQLSEGDVLALAATTFALSAWLVYPCRVIRLREGIDRGLANPWLRILLLLLLALLAVFVIFHATHDQLADTGGIACIALILFVVVQLVGRPVNELVLVLGSPRLRAPPRRRFAAAFVPAIASSLNPLRR